MNREAEQRREALGAAILDAAEASIAAAGLSGLSMREVARRAGCSPGMVYKLFAGEDDIVLRVNARTLAGIAARMRAALAAPGGEPGGEPSKALGEAPGGEPGGPAAGARRMALAYLDYAAAHPRRWDALFAHRMSGGAPVPPWYAAERDACFGLLAGLLGGEAPEPARAWAHTVFSAVHGVVLLGLDEKLGDLGRAALRARVAAVAEALAGLPAG